MNAMEGLTMKKTRLLIYPMIIGILSIVQSIVEELFWVHLEWKGKKQNKDKEKKWKIEIFKMIFSLIYAIKWILKAICKF